jgi:uncharacterized protein (DUF2147 family)
MLSRIATAGAAAGALLGLAALTATAAPPPAGLAGAYRVQGSGLIIAIADCGDGLCGRIVGLPDPTPQQAQPLSLCGHTVLSELHPAGQGLWQGKFQDPILGGVYTLNISRGSAKSGPALMVQRYSAPPFLTRSMARIEAWVSVAPPSTPCSIATPTS